MTHQGLFLASKFVSESAHLKQLCPQKCYIGTQSWNWYNFKILMLILMSKLYPKG